jgi:hypothetical protein
MRRGERSDGEDLGSIFVVSNGEEQRTGEAEEADDGGRWGLENGCLRGGDWERGSVFLCPRGCKWDCPRMRMPQRAFSPDAMAPGPYLLRSILLASDSAC